MKSYYNTVRLNGTELKKYNDRALSQDMEVLEFFKQHSNKLFTPSQVHKKLFSVRTPLTSVRRSISRLTIKENKLIKTDIKKVGIFGVPEYHWKYNDCQLSLMDRVIRPFLIDKI